MENRSDSIVADGEFSANAAQYLYDNGFVVVPNLIAPNRLKQLSMAYDSAFTTASPGDVRVGTTSTRLNDFVNRRPEFEELSVCRPLLEACRHVIGQPFKLSSMLGRTLHPNAPAQGLHIDFKADEERFPLVSYIWMINEFRSDNGATQFLSGSHNWSEIPLHLTTDYMAEYENQIVKACGRAGSLIIFNGSVLHGHSPNKTNNPRRSIQGAFIPCGYPKLNK
jgi:ectoine hydroxylase-related dioxygenase (phytanoyl-CoA dioxygenase family)